MKNFPVSVRRIVDTIGFYKYLQTLPTDEKIKTKPKKVTLDLVDELLEKGSIILYLDSYVLFKVNHYPHFVTVLKKKSNSYIIFDPWDGKEKRISRKRLLEGISSLKAHLKFPPPDYSDKVRIDLNITLYYLVILWKQFRSSLKKISYKILKML